MKVLLIGVGMQGKAALYNLVSTAEVKEVVAADSDVEMLERYVASKGWSGKVQCERVDAADRASLDRLMAGAPDVAIDLLPVEFIGNVARSAVAHGVHLVNTFYVPRELRALDAEARSKGVTILPEFGLDPGIDLVMLGDAVRSLDKIEEVHSYGAGIPELEAANNPIKYKVSWIFEGALNFYRLPARAIRDDRIVDIEGLKLFSQENVHHVEIEGLGQLEAFPNGDAVQYAAVLGEAGKALRAAGRYTMRWPGHCAFWKSLVELHLLDFEPVVLDGSPVDRLRFLAAAIGPHIQYAPNERDLAIVRVVVVGLADGKRKRLTYDLVDRRDLKTGLSAMSRTVGFTASIGAVMIAAGKIKARGVISPVTEVSYQALVDALQTRDIRMKRQVTEDVSR
jgi:lysine 6-dehydrogenase